MGQDTAQAELYRGKMLWFWGDTDRTAFPLGNFFTSGAVATLPTGGAEEGLVFHYFTGPDGFVRGMVPSTKTLPIWVGGLTVLNGKDLYAHYAQVKSLSEIDSSGYLKWNDAKGGFDIIQTFATDRGWRYLDSHTVQVDGYVLGNDPPNVRVKATATALLDPNEYESYTCLEADGTVRRVDGKAQYHWQKTLPPITFEIESRLVSEGKLRQEEAHFLPLDETGTSAIVVSGSVHWNAYRKRWVAIFGRNAGKDSFLGEIDYGESDAPTGPFQRVVKVVDHPHYSFYNPVHHPFLDKGSSIYFEGTYTAEFSGNPDKTSLYNYNQLLYKLDLNDPRLALAQGRVPER